MEVLVVTFSADASSGSEIDVGGDPPARVLAELGCAVHTVSFERDPAHLSPHELGPSVKLPQAIVLDARDRIESGYAYLKALRARPEFATTPALLIASTTRLQSLDFGAVDDFVLFPIVPAELYARLRQLDWRLSAFESEERLKVGDLVIDLAGYEANLRDRRLELTHQEFELLKFLAQHRGKVFTREQLLAKVWGYRYFGGTRTVDIHVRRLRAKLGSPSDEMIETVRNVGYKMQAT